MTDFQNVVLYIAFVAILGFVIGRIIPKEVFDPFAFPFRSFVFEKNGKIYDSLKIRKWMNKLPDLSKIFKKIMPPKKIGNDLSQEHIMLMLRETCIAEFVHILSCILGIPIIGIYRKRGRFLIYFLFTLIGNIPYIIIQRYNRPRLARLYKAIEKRSSEKSSELVHR
ncbi:MAG: glycosyl-4,4'-diaponeurosporenoate acyltransferase [Ruminococcaceae bacterium]|nr:glycosyl-4,4'-diaponeurosporenoate acyltransferase [Oscillospiraceae bacterium]